MATNYPGPYEIEYDLTGWVNPPRSHVLRVSCIAIGSPAPGTLPASINIQKAGGGTGTLTAVADQLWSFLRLAYPSTVNVVGYTLWRYVPGTLAKDFISTGTVTTPAGSGGTLQIAGQTTLTFRSANGGILKVVLLESALAGNTQTALIPNAAGTPAQRIAAYVMSADNIIVARDDAFPVNPLRDSRGENERIWRDVYRS